jgi:hypothetical protein
MYFFTRIDSDIMLIRHEGPITLADSRQLRDFLRQNREKLLVDLTGTPTADSMQEFCRVRAMLPQTAFIGPEMSEMVCRGLPGKDYYMHEARQFATEAEALAWLHSDATVAGDTQEAAFAA